MPKDASNITAAPALSLTGRIPHNAKMFLGILYAAGIFEMILPEIAFPAAPFVIALNFLAPFIIRRIAPEATAAVAHARWLFLGGTRAAIFLGAALGAFTLTVVLGLTTFQGTAAFICLILALGTVWVMLLVRNIRGLAALFRDIPVTERRD